MSLSAGLTTTFAVEHPVALAPMDLVAGGRLAAAVSRAGGLGLIGGGYGDRECLEREFDRANGTRVGCGFITWSLARRPELLDVALERDPAAIMLSFGDPTPFVGHVHEAGARVICQVHNADQARAALDSGADALVAQGGEAGGHGSAERSTFTLVPEVADLIATRAPGTPLLAAGGVADGRGVAAALVLGADGALVGTRFWAAEEALVPAAAQRRVLASSGDRTLRTSVYDIVRETPWPSPYTGRVLRNEFTERWHGHETELLASLPEAQETYRAGKVSEDFDAANVTVGEGIGQIHDVRPAAEILRELVTAARGELDRHAPASPTTS